MKLAHLELRVLLTKILRTFTVELRPGLEFRASMAITYGPDTDLLVKFTRREGRAIHI